MYVSSSLEQILFVRPIDESLTLICPSASQTGNGNSKLGIGKPVFFVHFLLVCLLQRNLSLSKVPW